METTQSEKFRTENFLPVIDRFGGGLIDFDDVSAAVDGFWSGCRGLS